MKKCPYCAEEIQDEAVVCKHCGRDLAPVVPVRVAAAPAPSAPPKKKTPIWLMVGGGVVFLCLCVLAIGLIGSGGGNKAAPAQANTTTNVTVTAAAKTVLAPATSTPVPATATSNTRPEEAAYAVELSTRFKNYRDAYLKVNDQVQMITEDPSVVLDSDWKIKTGLYLGALDSAAERLENIPNVPAKFAHIDSLMDSLASETYSMTSNMARGIDHLDSAAIAAATTNVKNITAIMEQSTIEIQALIP